MYLFSRRVRLGRGRARDAMEWATQVCDLVTKGTELDLSLYGQVFGRDVGTVSWTCTVDDLTQLEAAQDKLMVDDGFAEAIERGAEFQTDGPHDSLIQILHGAPDPDQHIEYATIVHSVCAPGGLVRGVELGIQIAQRATELGGMTTSFGMHTTGAYGGVAWITTAPSLADLQASEAKVNGDPSFVKMVDDGAPGTYSGDSWATNQRMYRKLH